MGAEIYYFTGTGNSLALARRLATTLGEAALVPIRETGDVTDVSPVKWDAEITGIVTPVYCFGLPPPVARLLHRVAVSRSQYVFVVSNCAGNPGFALRQAGELLDDRGIKLNAALNVFMPTNYLPFGGAWSEERQQQFFARADRQLDEFAEAVKARRDVPARLPKFPPVFLARWIYRLFAPKFHRAGKRFQSSDACTGCGLCTRICPVGNITMSEGRPVWGGRCEQCMACIQWCPGDAIRMKGVDPQKKHYHHPAIKADDLGR